MVQPNAKRSGKARAAFNGLSLARDQGEPLYLQLFLAIKERIHSGALVGGDVLPGEPFLVRQLGVSRITVQRAFRELAAAGLVRRVRGFGTMIAAAEPQVSAHLAELLDDLAPTGDKRDGSLLELWLGIPEEDVAELLALSPQRPVVRVDVLRAQAGRPFALATSWLSGEIKLQSLRKQIRQQGTLSALGALTDEARQAETWIEACAADVRTSKALECPSGAPLLRVTRVLRDKAGVALEARRSHFLGDRFRWMAVANRRRTKARDGWGWGG